VAAIEWLIVRRAPPSVKLSAENTGLTGVSPVTFGSTLWRTKCDTV
jgi:hypothetical protein